ncbi:MULTISPECIES: CaiB/BaiF CoA-transferase family protein [unclassified Gordonia (in: high G+C Gram-positive bacteria)]|uniref:CaiB/BaiF CoA transferase family protein n=1 Tax=unclassified Gordonia (in: high G+C Gram-positive bacteria) TaxID=2657482 RepID=UPI0009ACC5AC|nr:MULTISPECIES: CaiB/BaiF CoA-transferase family protein [unclassified Gordonia (in: high G+C Gram-positive bacteria)]MDF3281598.1 CaiB/BaiF CoA-transferase family protein [Gordonia sp. N1V]OPX17305.1 carnitine dehydratase [Gordonia sp. i37]
MSGPLEGIRVLEMAGLGPTPHACMVLADLGADVVQVRRPGGTVGPDGIADADAGLWRGRRVIDADLKDPDTIDALRQLLSHADILVEGFRPGVMERLGLGPDEVLEFAPHLIYARMTGWGQGGSYQHVAGHDINYLAMSGILDAMGPAGAPPIPPLSLVADFGGGSMFLVVGVLAALFERERSGGQVIDAAMTDGAAVLAQLQWSWKSAGRWTPRETGNLLDGSTPFYCTYACADGYVAVGALEEPFWRNLIEVLELRDLPDRWDRANWPVLRDALAARFAGATRAAWTSAFDGVDACVTAVLDFDEAARHPYARERGSYVEVGGRVQPAPAPRFSRSVPRAPVEASASSIDSVLEEWD